MEASGCTGRDSSSLGSLLPQLLFGSLLPLPLRAPSTAAAPGVGLLRASFCSVAARGCSSEQPQLSLSPEGVWGRPLWPGLHRSLGRRASRDGSPAWRLRQSQLGSQPPAAHVFEAETLLSVCPEVSGSWVCCCAWPSKLGCPGLDSLRSSFSAMWARGPLPVCSDSREAREPWLASAAALR